VLDFISYNRLNTFIDRLVAVRNTVTSTSYVDNSPSGLFTSPVGTILQKRGNIFSYKYPTDSDFRVINYANNSITKLCDKYQVLLTDGINKNVTWVKLDNSPGTKWENRGVKNQSCVICEIAPSSPCSTPIVTYLIPTPTPYFYYFDDVIIGTLRVKKLIVNNTMDCPPTGVGSYGQVIVCENYLYVYDGIEWKRLELSIYY